MPARYNGFWGGRRGGKTSRHRQDMEDFIQQVRQFERKEQAEAMRKQYPEYEYDTWIPPANPYTTKKYNADKYWKIMEVERKTYTVTQNPFTKSFTVEGLFGEKAQVYYWEVQRMLANVSGEPQDVAVKVIEFALQEARICRLMQEIN